MCSMVGVWLGACQLRSTWLNFTKVHTLWHLGGKTTDSNLWDPNKRRRCTFSLIVFLIFSHKQCFFSDCVEDKTTKTPSPDLYTDQESAESNSDPKPFDTRPDGKKNKVNHNQRTLREGIENCLNCPLPTAQVGVCNTQINVIFDVWKRSTMPI